MFFVEDVMLSDAIRDTRFGCRLMTCKGKCCEEGESGAPLTELEAQTIEAILPIVASELEPSGLQVASRRAVVREQGRPHTPLVGEAGPCAYLIPGEGSVKICAFEKLFKQGKIGFLKPVSCHLFPLIFKETMFYRSLSLQTRESCMSSYGATGPHIVEFLKEPLIRQFGADWVKKLFLELNLTFESDS